MISSSTNTDDFFIGFDRDRNRRQRQLTNNKNIKGKYHHRILPKDNFGFSQGQEVGIFGLGYKLALTKNTDDVFLNKDNAINNAKTKHIATEWYVTHYTSSFAQHATLSK